MSDGAQQREVLETYTVLTATGGNLTASLAAMALICLVALGVSVFGGTPEELEGWVWTFPVAAGLFAAPAVWLWIGRRRALRIVRDGEVHRLVVEGEVDIAFPLVASRSQLIERVNGLRLHHVHLKLVGQGGAVVVHALRGAVHGPQPDWPTTGIDTVIAAVAYDVTRNGQVAELLARVEQINRTTSPS